MTRLAGGAALRLVAHAPTATLRQAVFGADDDLDEGGLRAALVLAGNPAGAGTLAGVPAGGETAAGGTAGTGTRADTGRGLLGRADDWLSGPSRAAVQTARAAGREPAVVAALADTDYGRWSGRSLAEVADAEPEAVGDWLSDPDAVPHGGESITALTARVAGWLDERAAGDRRAVAFVPAAVVRAALVHALGLPPAALRQVDVAPLSVTRLRWRAGRWSLHLPPLL